MSGWDGADGAYDAHGMPHVTKVVRKPRGVGAEMKAIGCGRSGIIWKLDLLEGQEREALKQHNAEYGAGTGVCLRLAAHLQRSGRIIVGDSAFSSVKTCMALWRSLGLYFIGIVKTAHFHYPKLFFTNWHRDYPNLPRGI